MCVCVCLCGGGQCTSSYKNTQADILIWGVGVGVGGGAQVAQDHAVSISWLEKAAALESSEVTESPTPPLPACC